MIGNTKQYIKDQVFLIDNSLVEFDSPFSYENIPETIIDNSYHLDFNIDNVVNENDAIFDHVIFKLTFFKKGYNKVGLTKNLLFDKFIQVRNNITCIKNRNDKDFSHCLNTGIELNHFITNDNLVIIQGSFDFQFVTTNF